MLRSLACIAVLLTGCLGGYAKPMASLDTQRKTILSGNTAKSRLGQLDADLNIISAKYAIAASEGMWVRFRGVMDDKFCVIHQIELSGSKRQIADNAREYLEDLRTAMVVVQAHDTLDDSTRWEKRAKTDLRSAKQHDAQVATKNSKYLENEDGSAKQYSDGTIAFEVCTAIPPVTASTRYISLRMAPNTDGQQLFVWSIEPREADEADDSTP